MKNSLQKANFLRGVVLLCFFSIQHTLSAQHFIFEYTGPSILYVDNDCVAELEWGNSTPTVAPAHPGNGQIITFFDLDNISGGYSQGDTIPPGEQIAINYIAVDNMGNDSLFTFTIDFSDTIPPVIAGILGDITVECDAVPSPESPVATDNCDPAPMLTFNEVITSGVCNDSYTITWTWTATDIYGNSNMASRVITVFDDTDPTFVLPSDITVDCADAGNLVVTGSPVSIMDNCDANPIIYFSDITTSGYCPHTYTITRTWQVEDDCMNSASGVQLITVEDVSAPLFVNEAIDGNYNCDTDTNAENAFFAWAANFGDADATDNCTADPALRWFAAEPGSYDINDTLTYPGTLPAGLDPVLCPSPIMGVYRSKTVDFVVYDLCGNASLTTATFNVVDNTLPVFDYCPSDTTISNDPGLCEATYDLPAPIISDECSDSLVFKYSVNGSIAVLVDPISSVTEVLPVGVNIITYYATDCTGNTASCVYTVNVEDVDAPVITCPTDITVALGTEDSCNLDVTLPLPVSISDNCGFQTNNLVEPINPAEALLTFSYEPDYLEYVADDKIINFSGTSANAVGSTVTLEITTTGDVADLEAYFTIFSEDNINLGTTEVGQPNVLVTMDTCPGQPINVTTITIPVSLFNSWASDGNVSFTAVSNTDFAAPAPGGTSDGINPSCVNFPPGTPDGTNDGVSNLVMALIYNYATPSYFADGATVIPTTEMSSPNIAPNETFDAGTTTVYYIVEDIAGNADTCSFEVTVEDNISPEALCQATTIFVNPSGLETYILDPTEVDGGSNDNCGIASMSVTPDSFTCDQQGMTIPVTLTVTDIYGNMASCVALVKVETELPLPTYAIGLCGNDTLSLFANPPPATGGVIFTYSWNGPNGFVSVEQNPQIPNANPSNSGSYAVTVTGITGCTAIGTVEVSINASPDVPIMSVNSNDLCSSDEIILTSQTYSGTVVTYYWYEGIFPTGSLISTTATPILTIPSPLPAGTTTYYVIVEVDGCSSQASNIETVNVTQGPVATVNDPVIDVCEGETIILGTSETGPNYTYAWTGPNGFTSTLQNPPSIIATLADDGTYTLVISENNCPSSPVTTEVDVTATPSTPIISSSGVACEGGNITLATNIVDGDFYTWTAPDFSTQVTATNSLLINGVTPDDAGDWRVVVTKNGCDSEISNPFEVFVEPIPTVLASNDSPVCSSDQVQLSVNTIPGATYSWSGPSGFTSFIQNPLAPANAGTYSVTVTSSTGCSNSGSTDVSVNALPVITALSNDGAPCVTGANDIHLIATIFPPDDGTYTYLWTGVNSFNSTDVIPTLPNGTASDNGSYMLVVTNSNGCSSFPVTTVVNVSDVPATPTINGPSQLCETENLTLTTQAYNGTNVLYTWETPLGSIETTTPSLTIISVTTLNSGIYQVNVNVDGCESNLSGDIIVDINPIPATPIAISNAPVCEGSTIELLTDFIPGALYTWTGPTGFSASVYNPAIFNASEDDEGAYSVQVIVEGCPSTFSAPINVMVNPTPNPPSVTDNGPVCIDNPGANLILSVSPADAIPGASYTWYNAQLNIQVGGPTTALNTTLVDFSNYSEGVYDFYVVVELNGCPAVSSVPTTVTMNEIPNNQAFAGDDIQVCNEMSVALDATPPTIGSGLWTQVSGPSVIIANPNSATSTISGLTGGNTYTFNWSLSNGACVDYDFDEVAVIVDENIEEAEAGLNFDVCNETTTLLNATLSPFGAIGVWTQTPAQSAMGVIIVNPSDPNSMITGLEADNEYIFTWSLSNTGCGEFSSDEVIVSVQESDEIAFAGEDFVSCGDGETTLNAAIPVSGTGTWSVNDPEVIFVDVNDPQTIAQGLQTGIYSFIWTLDNGACGETFDEIEVEYELAPEAIDDEFTVNYASSANFNVLNNDLLDGPVNVDIVLNPSNGTIENLGNGVLEYTANSSFTGTDEFAYQICSQACEAICSEATVFLRIGDDVGCIAPTIFTPNNDGVNDAFIVPCFATGNYPQNEVSIFNQWGDVVFHASPYFNDWKGTFDGQDLPVGTYYFVVKFNNNQAPVSGFLVLER